MWKKNLIFILAVFAATTLLMAVQKPLFMAYNLSEISGLTASDWFAVLYHGLSLDLTVAGYITALPLLVGLIALWIPLSQRFTRGLLIGYFALIALFSATIFAVDMALYEHWGFRIDATILIYLTDPKEAMASVDFWLGVRQVAIALLYGGAMIGIYAYLTRRFFTTERIGWRTALGGSTIVLLLAGGNFVAIRGGLSASVANVSKVYFSPTLFLNHAATNPVFSFLSSLGNHDDYAAAYPFFDETERATRFESLRGGEQQPDRQLLTAQRPNVVLIILESFARTVMDAQVDGEPVMPHLQRLKDEGVWFENFFANSFRTDRGEVAIMSGFPAQTQMSIMKLPAKSRTLPSVARSLVAADYATSFSYGGDLNFTDQASYMYATGWQELIWQKDLHFDTPASDWGYDDRLMCRWFAERVIRLDAEQKPFLAGLLTLSSHKPFDVPYHKFSDPVLNAMAFSDECVGQMIDSLRVSPAWKNLLIVLVADHGYPYPRTLAYNEPLRHRIPMIWTGGAVAEPAVVESYASQIDLCATLLGQMNLPHSDFEYSKDIFAPAPPRKFAYYTFNDGFGVVDATGEAIWDAAAQQVVRSTDPELLDIGRTMLQTTYVDIDRR